MNQKHGIVIKFLNKLMNLPCLESFSLIISQSRAVRFLLFLPITRTKKTSHQKRDLVRKSLSFFLFSFFFSLSLLLISINLFSNINLYILGVVVVFVVLSLKLSFSVLSTRIVNFLEFFLFFLWLWLLFCLL